MRVRGSKQGNGVHGSACEYNTRYTCIGGLHGRQYTLFVYEEGVHVRTIHAYTGMKRGFV